MYSPFAWRTGSYKKSEVNASLFLIKNPYRFPLSSLARRFGFHFRPPGPHTCWKNPNGKEIKTQSC